MIFKIILGIVGFMCLIASSMGEDISGAIFGLICCILCLAIKPVENIENFRVVEAREVITKSNGKQKLKTFYIMNGDNIGTNFEVKNYKVLKTFEKDYFDANGVRQKRTVYRVRYRAK